MKEQLTNELIKLLQSANGAATGAKDILKEKIPEICSQIISWELIFHGVFTVLFLITTGVGIYIMKKRHDDEKKQEYYNEADGWWVFGIGVAIVGGLFTLVNILCVLYTIISPDLVVINYCKYLQ